MSNKNNSGASRDNDERMAAWRAGLRSRYDGVAQEPLPDRICDLLKRLVDVERRKR